jgi:dephospho-CoA kinase
MSDFIIGLTGGIASGKSELSRRFEARGIQVIDADITARQIVACGPLLERIRAHFGAAILLPDGTLDRRALRAIVFADPRQRQALEAITHPAIRIALQTSCQQAPGPYAIAAIPLLCEAGGRRGYPWLQRILLVDVPVELQHSRLIQRDGIDAALASQMIAAQASRQQRQAIADDVIVNDGATTALDQQVQQLDQRYRRLAAEQAATLSLQRGSAG